MQRRIAVPPAPTPWFETLPPVTCRVRCGGTATGWCGGTAGSLCRVIRTGRSKRCWLRWGRPRPAACRCSTTGGAGIRCSGGSSTCLRRWPRGGGLRSDVHRRRPACQVRVLGSGDGSGPAPADNRGGWPDRGRLAQPVRSRGGRAVGGDNLVGVRRVGFDGVRRHRPPHRAASSALRCARRLGLPVWRLERPAVAPRGPPRGHERRLGRVPRCAAGAARLGGVRPGQRHHRRCPAPLGSGPGGGALPPVRAPPPRERQRSPAPADDPPNRPAQRACPALLGRGAGTQTPGAAGDAGATQVDLPEPDPHEPAPRAHAPAPQPPRRSRPLRGLHPSPPRSQRRGPHPAPQARRPGRPRPGERNRRYTLRG